MKYFKVILLLISFLSYSQDYKALWSDAVQDELNGKTESAYKKVQNIYSQAKKENNEEQIIKCFFYVSKFRQVFEEKAQENIITDLRKEITIASPISKSILNYIYGSILVDYFNYNSYKINQTTSIDNPSNDFLTWSVIDFKKEISKSFSEALKEEAVLSAISINKFSEILEIPAYVNGNQTSLFDLLTREITAKYFNLFNNYTLKENFPIIEKEIEILYTPSNDFINLNTRNYDSLLASFIGVLQQREKYFLLKNETDTIRFERLQAIDRLFKKSFLLESQLTALENTTKNKSLKYELILRRAKNLNSSNLKKEALTLLEEIIKANPDEYITSCAMQEKEDILDKQLNIKLKKISYENENIRAFIESRNIDSLKISYYKINRDDYLKLISNKNTKKDNTLQFLVGKKTFFEELKSIPNPKNHNLFSTEFLLNKLPLGNYIVVFEDTDKLSNTEIAKNYSFHTVTNIIYIEDENENKDLFYLLDRKTGKPLTEAFIKNRNKTIKANDLGKIEYPKLINEKKRKPLNSYLIQANDTLVFTYHQSIKNNDYHKNDDDEFEAKPLLYLDRAIYRPGQKVFLKGIIVQNKNNKRSVVPKLTVHLVVENASNETITEFDLQTNEFGSFSSEFDLPKDGLTGEFSIDIEEPDDELFKKDKKYFTKKDDIHTFWDNVNFDNQTFYFKVEEYKRPTFEITFDKIKDVYSIGDTLQLKGFAKTLAGSNLTYATVKYSISRNYYGEKHQYKYDTNYIQKEITTNENGEFFIPITTTIEGIKNEELNDNSFNIEVSINDTNGETRTITKRLVVKKETLKINSRINPIVFLENENKLNIEIVNLDDYSISTKGKIEIFKKKTQNYLKSRQFGFPEIQSIKEEEFKKLFPYEPYSNDDYSEPLLVNKLFFDTGIGNDITISILEKGYYKVVSTIIDAKNNSITSENHFEVKSKENPLSHNQIFAYRQIDKENQDEIRFELNTILPQLYITTRYYNGKNLIEEKITELINGKGIVAFKKLQNPIFDYSFHFSTQWENDGYSQNVTLSKETQSRKINFEVLSFKNKIEPGSQQKWSFKISDNKLETEVLASMYDSSLDAFTKENWKKPYFYNYTDVDFPDITEYNFDDINFYSRSKKVYYQKITFKPQFQWFGFSYTNPKNNYIKKQYEKDVAQVQIILEGSKQITGIVSDSSGPLPGANVVVKGTQRGVSTNFDGSYSIYAKEGEVLVYSFMGMRELSKVVGASNTINSLLKDDSKNLAEVVVTAVGIKRADDTLNPNIIIVTSNDRNLHYFSKYNSEIISALSGKVSGIYIESTNENSTNVVKLRAPNSLSETNNALLVIDGTPYDYKELNTLNEKDITSITILKAKEATNLYGAKGANGVIIVNTKKALNEVTQVKTRTNFNETAFFYPHLTTDNKGEISFNFTTPESLTRWKLRLLGHDKNADVGTFETEIISQKDIMIMPNMPRFLRETDTITISAKVVNLSKEVKSGIAILQLFDAQTGNTIDELCLNVSNTRSFNCKSKDNSTVSWQIYIPEGIQGIQYKVIAKSGSYSDGEENILPVLSNKILVTEAMPIWIRENSKKDLVFENLKNNTSRTIKNQSYTFEYTSNPTWLAIQSLPYLMEFEHECAEQTFARFYANTIASKIIDSQPKIAEVFEKWKKEPNKKSKLEINEELKSIILRETPWVLDGDEKEKNKRIATLFDLQKLKESNESALKKLKEKQTLSGGFAWFDSGIENYNITQHILSGIGHLNKIFPSNNLNSITDKAIPFIDTKFIASTQKQRKEKTTITNTELQYLYCRSFFTKQYTITNDSLKKAIEYQIQQTKTHWLQLSIGQKAMLALSAKRFGDSIYAHKILTHLKETAIKNNEKGMFWLENKSGYDWFDSPIENQALLIETFSEIENDTILINNLKAWLINQKQKENWGTTKATTEAIYALLTNGNNLNEQKNDHTFNIGNKQILEEKIKSSNLDTTSGYLKLQWKTEEINKDLATITIENKSNSPNHGGVYWQYFESLENIKTNSNTSVTIQKEVFKKVKDKNGDTLISLKNTNINIGDKLTIRLIIKVTDNLEFVHLKDLRASCLEPTDVISKHKESNDLWYYMSNKDTATHFFFDEIKQGTYVLEYDALVNNSGNFNNGIATIQSMYAPEFSAHSSSEKIKIDN